MLLRRRKNPPHKYKDTVKSPSPVSSKKSKSGATKTIWAVNTLAGYLVMVWISYQFSRYLYQLHENDMWFSEIMVSLTISLLHLSRSHCSFAGGGARDIIPDRAGSLLFLLQTAGSGSQSQGRIPPTET